jgi:hypothetical protein
MAEKPDPEAEAIRRQAKQLATSQGLNWKELPRERRREFKNQIKMAKPKGERRGGG